MTNLHPGVSRPLMGGEQVTFNIVETPNFLNAALESMKHLKLGEAHDTLHLQLNYAPSVGGLRRPQTIDIPVAFSPSFWNLALDIVIGSLLGFILRVQLSTSKISGWKLVARSYGGALASVVVIELVLDLIVSPSDRPLVLFGVNVDPKQSLSCFLIALFASGGPATVKWVRDQVSTFVTLVKNGLSSGTGE